ncbi:MAG TPA: hypothetical protein VLF68_01525 [Candidatus Saccharimonadales bacterium]|nr:hypothetical protein [Candidatus Saccharimonadales bacterium]
MENRTKRFKQWYHQNLARIVSLLLLAVIFGLLFVYVPYVNLILTPSITFAILLVCYLTLFPATTRRIVIGACVALFFGFVFSALKLDSFAQDFGDIVFLLLVVILIQHVNGVVKEKRMHKK